MILIVNLKCIKDKLIFINFTKLKKFKKLLNNGIFNNGVKFRQERNYARGKNEATRNLLLSRTFEKNQNSKNPLISTLEELKF